MLYIITYLNGAGPCTIIYKDTDDYELYDPRIHSLRGRGDGDSNYNQSAKRGPILVNRPPKNTKPKQEVGNACLIIPNKLHIASCKFYLFYLFDTIL